MLPSSSLLISRPKRIDIFNNYNSNFFLSCLQNRIIQFQRSHL
jgi:hypothetical protein